MEKFSQSLKEAIIPIRHKSPDTGIEVSVTPKIIVDKHIKRKENLKRIYPLNTDIKANKF